jgi:hypothetical protein
VERRGDSGCYTVMQLMVHFQPSVIMITFAELGKLTRWVARRRSSTMRVRKTFSHKDRGFLSFLPRAFVFSVAGPLSSIAFYSTEMIN